MTSPRVERDLFMFELYGVGGCGGAIGGSWRDGKVGVVSVCSL
jgi:hypothetical protein